MIYNRNWSIQDLFSGEADTMQNTSNLFETSNKSLVSSKSAFEKKSLLFNNICECTVLLTAKLSYHWLSNIEIWTQSPGTGCSKCG